MLPPGCVLALLIIYIAHSISRSLHLYQWLRHATEIPSSSSYDNVIVAFRGIDGIVVAVQKFLLAAGSCFHLQS
ncbi:hypothetical protein F5Y06DRAFT_278949 [Hypoxylon sp. FL0890]|nr:hypothetical protein F5Y06DRAFT_278949 [Hypoxylon sp. FL0890]